MSNLKTSGERGVKVVEGDGESSAPRVEMECELERVRSRSSSVSSRRSDVCKRKRCVDVDDCEDVEMDDIRRMKSVSEKLRKFLFTESNRISKGASEFILNTVGEYEEHMMRLIGKNAKLQGKIEECERSVMSRGMSSVDKSYASVVGRGNVKSVSDMRDSNMEVSDRSVKDRSFAVVVKSKDMNVKMTSEQVKDKVMREVSKGLNVRVRAVRKTRSGGIVIETVSEAEVGRISECRKFNEIGLKVETPRKIGPKLIVYDVPNEVTNDDFMAQMYIKNLRGYTTESEFKERVRIVSRNIKKGATYGNMILEVSSAIRRILNVEGRVYIDWRAFKVRDFVGVLRCHKCYAYGHMMRECSVKERLCQKCGDSGHMMKECRKECICRNCKFKGNTCDHSVLSNACPEFIRALQREKAKINDE